MTGSTHQKISIVLAAGASSRMKSSRSKLLCGVLGKPLIGWAIDQARTISDHVYIVTGHQREEVEKSSREYFPEVRFALQKEPKGTADAVRSALQVLPAYNEAATHVFIMGGADCLLRRESLQQLVKNHEESGAVLSVLTANVADPAPYGRIVRNSQGGIEKIVEAKEATPEQLAIHEINTGFYLIQLKALKEGIAEIMGSSKTREFYLPDLVSIFRKNSLLVRTEILNDSSEALGVNTQEELAQITDILRRRILSRWMAAGVSMSDPATTWVDDEVTLEPDVHLESGVILKGRTHIREGSVIGAYSVVENSKIGPNCKIEAYSHMKEASLATGCTIGPFARLRPGSDLREDVHIGNFVEVKKSKLEKGVKAGHLTYLGDAAIGPNSNIGAGTITCNYDGFDKHATSIGENVFVGSNTSLVAPVKIGAGAIIGAGSVITKSVENDAMAVERADQRELKNGAKRFRDKRTKK